MGLRQLRHGFEGLNSMTADSAKSMTGFIWRCIAVVCALSLLTYGHWVLSDTRIFACYAALCLFAVAIVFYQTTARAVRYRDENSTISFDRSSAYQRMMRLSSELLALEEEYKNDVLRLEGKWL